VHVLVGAGVEDPALLERSDELSALEAALAGAAVRRRGRVVLVRGEAGIGKTLLLRRFCEEVSARVLWAACDPLFTPRPRRRSSPAACASSRSSRCSPRA